MIDKLGLKSGFKARIINSPPHYFDLLGRLPPNIKIADNSETACDFIHFFTKDKSELEAGFPALKQSMAYTGMLWISWPKKSSKVPTDLNENIIREIGLANGLVDVKVCAVDDIWSGLKFVYRVKDRK